jgi:hypothetical protein
VKICVEFLALVIGLVLTGVPKTAVEMIPVANDRIERIDPTARRLHVAILHEWILHDRVRPV